MLVRRFDAGAELPGKCFDYRRPEAGTWSNGVHAYTVIRDR